MTEERKPPSVAKADPTRGTAPADGTGKRSGDDRSGCAIDDTARRRLGQNLRLFYASVLNEPLPDRFTNLVGSLGRETATTSSKREG